MSDIYLFNRFYYFKIHFILPSVEKTPLSYLSMQNVWSETPFIMHLKILLPQMWMIHGCFFFLFILFYYHNWYVSVSGFV